MYDLHVQLSGVPSPFDSHVGSTDKERLVRVEEALLEGLKKLVAEARASVNGAGSVVAADGEKTSEIKLTLTAKKDGKSHSSAVFKYHDVPESYAKGIGEAFAAIDDAVAKG